jgi:hypothetical protein
MAACVARASMLPLTCRISKTMTSFSLVAAALASATCNWAASLRSACFFISTAHCSNMRSLFVLSTQHGRQRMLLRVAIVMTTGLAVASDTSQTYL